MSIMNERENQDREHAERHHHEPASAAPAPRATANARGEQLLHQALAELRTDHPAPTQLRHVMKRIAPRGSADEHAMLAAVHQHFGNAFVDKLVAGAAIGASVDGEQAEGGSSPDPGQVASSTSSSGPTATSVPSPATTSAPAPAVSTSLPQAAPVSAVPASAPSTSPQAASPDSTATAATAPTPAVVPQPVTDTVAPTASTTPTPSVGAASEAPVTRAELDEEVRRGVARDAVDVELNGWLQKRLTGIQAFREIADLDDPKLPADTDWLELFVKNVVTALLSNTTFHALDFIAGKVIGSLKGAEKMREMVEAPRPSQFYKKVLVPSDKAPGRTADNEAAIAAVKQTMGQIKQLVGARVNQAMGKVFAKPGGGGKQEKSIILTEFVATYRNAVIDINSAQARTMAHMTGVNADALEAYANAVRDAASTATESELAICSREWALAVAHSVHGTSNDAQGKVTKLDKPKPNQWAPGTDWNVEKGGLLQIELDMGYSDGDLRKKTKAFHWKSVATSGINQGTLAQLIHLAGGHIGKVSMPKMITIRTGSDLYQGTIGLLIDEHGTIQAVHKNKVPDDMPLFDNPAALWAVIQAAPIPDEFRLSHLVYDARNAR